MNQYDIQACAELRKKIFITACRGGMGHLASGFSSVDIIYALYLKDILRYDPKDPNWKDRDRFILSKGHAGLALYAVLARAGLISETMMQTYLKPEALIGGEPCTRDCPWVEASTGSLGHGLSIAVGMAMALKMDHSPAKVYVMLGDGECQEGSIWEAAMSAAAFHLDNLVAILDSNRIQKMTTLENTMGAAQWQKKWAAFGWQVAEMDGHDTDQICQMLKQDNLTDMPRMVIAHTVKGKGVSIMENNPNWHFKMPNRKELKVFKGELNIMDSELE